MHDDELKKMWQSAPQQEFVQFINSKENLKDMNTKIQKLDRTIEVRNLREVAVGVGVIGTAPVYLLMTETVLSKICFILILFATAFIVYKWLKVRRSRKLPNRSMSIREQLENTYTYLNAERKLLQNITYWYILPITVPLLVLILNEPWYFAMKVVYLLIGALVIVWTYSSKNKLAKQFDEPIRELNEAIKQLEE